MLLSGFATAHAQPAGAGDEHREEHRAERARFHAQEQEYRESLRQQAAFRERGTARSLAIRYTPALQAEQRETQRARQLAIAELETFVAAHPDDPQHTPDALIRLAELQLVQALERAEGLRPLDLRAPIATARRVVRDFAGAPARSRASYLMGWCLAAGDRDEDAAEVWRLSVCPDDPSYAQCPRADGDMAMEMFLRLGRYHAERGELAAARGAYGQVASHPTHRLAPRGCLEAAALARRSADGPGALSILSALLDRPALSVVLHAEALDLFAAIVADEDWNLDGRPDHTVGGPHPLERLEDRRLYPHDRDWTGEVYLRVGLRLHRAAHPDEARMAWRLAETHAPDCAAGLRALRTRLPADLGAIRPDEICE